MAFKPYKNGLKRLWKLKAANKLCKDFYVLDVETGKRKKDGNVHWCLDGRPQSFIFGVLYGYNYCKVIYSVEEFKKLLLDPRFKGKKIFAHNGGGYDYLVLFQNIYAYDPEAIFNGKFISFTNGVVTFADSMNVFVGASVATIGKMMGLHKGSLGDSGYKSKDVFPRKGIFEVVKSDCKDVHYCVRDCRIIWEALFTVFEEAGEIKITQASLSMANYRRFHQPFHIDHNENTKFFWESYYGGRCEAFKMGKTSASVIDVNSMYPDVMKTIKFPNPKILKMEAKISVKKAKKYLEWYEGLIYCDVIHSENFHFGFLPYKDEGKLKFPTGKFSGCWNFNEIRFALERGAIEIKKVHRIVYSEPMESPFVSYVDKWQEKKLQAELDGNDFIRDYSKRFQNSLYGKFGQRILEENIYLDDIEKRWHIIQDAQRNGTFVKLIPFNKKRNDAFLVKKSGKKMDVSYSIPSFASYITSAARVKLLSKMLELEKNNIVYCDTDSIFFEINDGKIKSEFFLGGWKVEKKIITEIKGLKNYRYIEPKTGEEIWRVKGVPVIKKDEKTGKPKTTKIFNDDDTETEVLTCEQTGENSFRYYNLVKTKEGLKRGLDPGQIIKREKTIKGKYDKRIVLKNGETKPINIL